MNTKKLILMTVFVLFLSVGKLYAGNLQFKDGKFTIMHVTDLHTDYPIDKTVMGFIADSLDRIKPDLVVLGGDIATGPKETKYQEIKDICSLFTDRKIRFSLVFGNHDCEHGYTNEELLQMYKKAGEGFCLAYDAVPSLTGCGNHRLSILSSDGNKVAMDLWMLDSGSYIQNSSGGGELNYTTVQSDQTEWLINNYNPNCHSFIFQHIIVQEIYDILFKETKKRPTGRFITNLDNNRTFLCIPDFSLINDGFVLEKPCPGYFNTGEFGRILELNNSVENGVKAIFTGHDHSNSFRVKYRGMDLVNTASAKPDSELIENINRGCRVITFNENNPADYDTYTLPRSKLGYGPAAGVVNVLRVMSTFMMKLLKFFSFFFF